MEKAEILQKVEIGAESFTAGKSNNRQFPAIFLNLLFQITCGRIGVPDCDTLSTETEMMPLKPLGTMDRHSQSQSRIVCLARFPPHDWF